MGRKPIIGLNAGFRGATKDGPAFSYVAAGFYDAVVKVGGIPLILPTSTPTTTSASCSTCSTA